MARAGVRRGPDRRRFRGLAEDLRQAGLRVVSPDTYADETTLDDCLKLLRDYSPVHWVAPPGVVPFWAVTRYADIRAVEQQTACFAAAPRTVLSTKTFDLALCQISGKSQLFRPLTHMDEPDHRTFRALTQFWFRPANLHRFEFDLRDLARQTVDRLEAAGDEFDFAHISSSYPLRVIMRMLGAPDSDMPMILAFARSVLGADDPDRRIAESPVEAIRLGMMGLCKYFDELTARRRANPGDDLTSVIANANIDAKPIPDFERLSYFIILATGGHDTTSFAISGGLHALIKNPSQFAALKSKPKLLDGAIEEMLRWSSPVRHFARTATRDCILNRTKISAGETVAVFFNSGNRDDRIFRAANVFQIERRPNPHMAFGYGIHFCLGYYLAKMEMRALFSELLRRVDHVELAGAPQWARSNFIGGIKSLPVRCRFRKVA
jgi:cytochrome P450